jgi:zinc transport system substrate-binding protein
LTLVFRPPTVLRARIVLIPSKEDPLLSKHRLGRAALVVVSALGAAACTSADATDDQGVSIVASAFPLAEAAERVTGGAARVENLTPPGLEPHDLELSPDDLEALVTADLVVYVGGGFQPAVEDAVEQAEGRALDALSVIEPSPPAPPDGGTVDPHVWLDPERYARIVEAVARAMSEVEPQRRDTFHANAEAFAAELEVLDRAFEEGLATCDRRTLVVNHAAFGFLADAYDLEQIAISGVSPEAEPDPARLAELRALVQEEGITTVFTEELASPEVAEALAQEAGVATAVLNPLEGLTQEQLDAGADYLSVMRENLETLRTALDCA